jgi:HAMP domain
MTTRSLPKKTTPFISLRLQLLVGFTLIFSGVFAVAYYWFYTFTSDRVLQQIKDDLVDTMTAAAKGVDGDVLLSLSETAEPSPEGRVGTLNPLYWDHVRWLATVERIEPRAYVYTYVAGPKPNTVVFIGSGSAVNHDRDFDGAKFLQYYEPTTRIYEGLSQLIVREQPYTDQWGSWITGYMPIENAQGKPLTAIGVDFRADYVIQVQQAIRGSMVVAFAVTYGTLFTLVYVISGVFTHPVTRLTKAAERIGEGDYDQDLFVLHNNRRVDDEMSTLARVFEMMVGKVRQREESLKQQVAELKIEIDQTKRKKQVSEIVDTDFFQELQAKARLIREKKQSAIEPESEAPNPTS